MAREIVTMQTRRGNSADFDETKMLAGEIATAVDTEQAYISFADGTAEELALKRDINNGGGNVEIPDTLPNPQALTFTGAVNASYDGSEAVTVNIPSGGGDGTTGTTDHAQLTNRDAADQHPITAVTGLQEALDSIAGSYGTTDHAQLTNRDAADQHPIGAITNLTEELDARSPAIIATATGDAIAVSGSSDRQLRGLTLYGKTTQNGIPSPTNPVPLVSAGDSGIINVRACKRNLIPYPYTDKETVRNGVTFTPRGDGGVSVNGVSSSRAIFTIGEFKLPAGAYTVSHNQHNIVNLTMYVKYENSAGIVYVDLYGGTKKTFTLTKSTTVTLCIDVREIGQTINNVIVYPMLCLASIEGVAYESYEGQTLTVSTPNGLPGIPVASGGNYTDENGQQWACDYKDYEHGAYVQRIFDANITSAMATSLISGGRVQIQCDAVNFPIALDAYGEVICKCNSFVAVSHAEYLSSQNCVFVNGSYIYLYLNANATLDDYKAVLDSNEVHVYYVRKTPIETPLPVEEIAAYKALHTNKPVTTILNDGGAGMEVTYVPDNPAAIYLDKRLSDIEAAIISTGGNI